MNAKLRAFFALKLDRCSIPYVRSIYQTLHKALSTESIRWVPESNWHITLHFIGSLASAHIDNLCQAVKVHWESLEDSYIEVGWPELFPSAHRPRVIALQVQASPNLHQLVHTLKSVCHTMGWRTTTRSWRPHLTLGYLKQHAPLLPPINRPKLLCPINEFYLLHSELLPQGSQYISLATFPLWV